MISLDPVSVLEGLVKAYSPSGREKPAVDYLRQVMEKLGFDTHIDRVGNVHGTIGTGKREILLLGHIDTVPGEIKINRAGDRLFGRGTVDAKGPLACFTMAACSVHIPADWRITVIGAVGEEGDSRGAKYLLEDQRSPEVVVIGEPSGWQKLTLGYKGSCSLSYEISRSQAHSAANNASACDQAFTFWHSFTALAGEFNASSTRTFDQISTTISAMHSSSTGFQQHASLGISLRIPPGVDQQRLDESLIPPPGAGRISWGEFIPAFRSEKNTPLVRAFLPAIRDAGGKPAFTLKSGTSDMNLVGPYWKSPILAYGPGDSNLDHTPEEHILISEYLQAVKVLSLALNNLLEENG